jgi:hypothetical protein
MGAANTVPFVRMAESARGMRNERCKGHALFAGQKPGTKSACFVMGITTSH